MTADTIAFWHEQAARTPMLKPAQEILLGKTIQEWISAEDPSPQLIRRGKKAQDRMIKSNLKLVISVCKKYSRRISRTANLEIIDLYQEGVIGLNRAAERFNPESGYKFSTYAFWWISQAVRRVVETQLTTIRAPNTAVQLHMRFLYRPEGQTLEQFAEAEGKPIEWVRQYLEGFNVVQTLSLDSVVSNINESCITRADIASTGVQDIEETEFRDILQQLKATPEIQDSLAILELSQQCKPGEMAPLLGCGVNSVRIKLKDCAAQIREHMPADLRERLNGKELNSYVRIEPIISLYEPSPLRELALINCCSTEPELMPEISTNGHHSLEAEAIAVIDELQTPEPTKQPRKRRSSAEVAASGTVALKINGMDMEGTAADVAAVLKAYSV